MPFISICIPAYKNATYLRRLMESISTQHFKDFEVIVSDDSNDNEVKSVINDYPTLKITYVSNQPALGSPANWNHAIKLAKGTWIKMMHDDDWFADEHALTGFAKAAGETHAGFIFSGFCEIAPSGKKDCYILTKPEKKMLDSSPFYLFKKNFIGHPSTTLIKNDTDLFYDESLKWVVDIEFYMRYLLKHKSFFAIEKPLINIGLNEFQITKASFRNPAVEIPENLTLFSNLPRRFLKNVFAYDYYWRLIRNLKIRKIEDMAPHAKGIEIPNEIKRMIKAQSRIPHGLLRNGVISKSLMILSYVTKK